MSQRSAWARWIRSTLKRNERLMWVYADLDLLRKYRTWRPERVTLEPDGLALFVDPSEPRGRALLRSRCRGQRYLKRLWRAILASLDPDVVLDVGANYGEFVFMSRYRPGVRVVAVEANPKLEPWLERSRAAHPASAQIELVCALAAAEEGAAATLYVDEKWSGRSSALPHASLTAPVAVSVATVTVDSLLALHLQPGARLFFKIDVEGFEPSVVAGMRRSLDRAGEAIGIVEYDPRRCQGDRDRYLSGLRERFGMASIRRDGSIMLVDDATLDGESDLLLFTEAHRGRELVERHNAALQAAPPRT